MKRIPPARTKPAADLRQLLAEAAACHARGDLQAAERKYRAVLAQSPAHFDALQLLGTARAQAGNAREAVELISRAIAINPRVAEAHNNLGYAFKALGRTAEAAECYRKALALKPGYLDADRNLGEALLALGRGEEAIEPLRRVLAARPGAVAHCNLGYAYRLAGRGDEAIAAYRQALAAEPGLARAHNGLGNALLAANHAAEALEAYDRALAIQADYAEAHNNRGNALVTLERREEAVAAYARALAIRPGYAEAHYNLGNVLRSVERTAEAIASYHEALAINPRHVETHNNLGTLLLDLNRAREADEVFQRALAIDPDSAEVHTNRGNALLALRATDEAIASYRRAAELKPGFAEAHNNLANILRIGGFHEEAIASYEKALALNPGQSYAPGKVAGSLAYLCDWRRLPALVQRVVNGVRAGEPAANPFVFFGLSGEPADQLACARAYVRDRYPAAAAPLWRGERHRHERIRVAYLSADFREHAVAWLIAELIERHDRGKFETLGVSFGPEVPSPMRQRLKAGFERFIDVRAKSDAEVAALLREWEVDIAVDLMGHTLDARLGILSRRPAPVQVSYLGFPATMGADYIDYIIADGFVVPPGAERHYSEKVVRLPDTFQVNDSRRRIAERTPTRAEAGLPERGFVYCCFNGTHKVTPEFFDVWMRLLARVEGSVLWLIARDEATAANLRREAQARGVAPGRLIFAPRVEHEHYLARYRLADLFLDTLPFNAGTTASDALWAGLPVLTCAGEAFASRMAGSLLRAVGLPELVTRTLKDYEELAVRLATRPEALRALRDRLAANRTTAPLFDTDRFRRNMESAYRTMWEITQRGEPPRSFAVAAGSVQAFMSEAEAHLGRGDAQGAERTYGKALAVDPDNVEARLGLGNAYQAEGRYPEAIESFRKVLALQPGKASAHYNLGNALAAAGRADEALDCYRRVVAIDPGHAKAHNNLGNVLLALGRREDAIEAYRKAVAAKPDYPDPHNNMGNALQSLNRHEEAMASYEAAVAIDPAFGYAAGMAASSSAHVCDWSTRPQQVRRLIDGVRAGKPVVPPLVFLLFSDDPADQLACAADFVRRRHPAAREPLWRGERYRHERIRVAYLSADFREHAVAWLIAELIERHDRGRFETLGISFGPDPAGATRKRLEAAFTTFIDVRAKSNAEIAAWLRAAEVDIAVDLMGHTFNSRIGIFAHRPAPVQVKYIGYAATTGADYMDYVLADSCIIPEAERIHYAEKIAYLPDCYLVSDTTRKVADRAPTRAEAGLPGSGFVFCCFNNTNKLTPEMFDIWMRLLDRVEGGVLWLVADEDRTIANLRREAQARGVDPERLVFAPRVKPETYLARYRLADLFLDTLPYNAHSTAIDALWMGLPVLTCPGRAYAARVAGSLLRTLGLSELIARSLEEYEALAYELATRPERHRQIRDKLAANRRATPLFDVDRYRLQLEAAYRTMWEIAQRGEPPRSFSVGVESSGSSLSSTTGTR